MSKNKKRKSKKQINITLTIATIMFFASIASVVICGLLTDNGYGSIWWPTIGLLSCAIFLGIALKLASSCLNDSIYYRNENIRQKYEQKKLFVLNNAPCNIDDLLVQQGFKLNEDKYLAKKKSSVIHEYINIYAQSIYIADKELTFENIISLISENNANPKNSLTLIFVFKDDVSEKDLIEFKDFSSSIAVSTTVPFNNMNYTTVITLIDRSTKRGYFFDAGKELQLSIYGYGCRFIKKLC